MRQVDVDAVWALASKRSRERSGKPGLRAALEAAVKQGHDIERIRRGVAGYFASEEATREEGRFAKGVHLVVRDGRWESFVEDEPPPLFAVARGSVEAPSEARQRGWMEDFRRSPAEWLEHVRGPRPGQPGCRVAAEIQREFGVEPAPPQPVGGRAA